MLKKGGFLTRDSRVVERKKYAASEGPPQLPVLEALITHFEKCVTSKGCRFGSPFALGEVRIIRDVKGG